MAKEISQAAIENFKADFASRKDARIAARAAQTNGILKLVKTHKPKLI